MLSFLRQFCGRRTLAIFVMVISACVLMQRVQSTINDLQHGFAIQHSDPVLELASAETDHHDHDLEHEHDAPGSKAADDVGGLHHHHVDGPQLATLVSPAPLAIILSHTEPLTPPPDLGARKHFASGLDRPPRHRSEDRA
jgi:hypothetical protein